MLIKLLIFLYVLSQIIFYDSITIIPKIIGGILAFFVIIYLGKNPKSLRVKWPIVVLFFMVLQAFLSLILNPMIRTEISIQSFILVSGLLFFFYQGLIISKGYRIALSAFCIGVFFNFILIIFFSNQFNVKQEWGRVFGTFGNPNYFAFMINIGFVFFIWLKNLAGNKWQNWITPFVIILSGIHIVLSGSKTNIFIFSLICILLFFSSKGDFNLRSFFKGIIVTFISITGILAFSNSSFVYLVISQDSEIWKRIDYLSGFFSGNGSLDNSDTMRINMINYGLKNWVDNPVFGHGFDSYTFLSGYETYSHNNIIENLFNGGLFGFLIFYSIYIYLFIQFKNKIKYNHISKYVPISLLIIFMFMEMSIILIDDKLFWLIIMTLTAVLSEKLEPMTQKVIIRC